MGLRLGLAIAICLLGANAKAADYKTLRNLTAPPPTQVTPISAGAAPRAFQLARIVFQPKAGEAWAIKYLTLQGGASDPRPVYEFLTWEGGRLDAETSDFSRAFDEELKAAGFGTEGSGSLFETNQGAADLKVGVLVEDIIGRFCADCPNILYRKSIPSTVIMTARWEIYSSLERKVITKLTTSGGFNYSGEYQGSVLPTILAAFRENVRQLINTQEFRTAATASSTPAPASTSATNQLLTFAAVSGTATLAQAVRSVAIVYAADGSGSGFVISPEGYLLTNQHVVGGSKYVKLKWPDGAETLGEVVRTDNVRDVALIKASGSTRPALALRTGSAQLGEAVFAVGTPLDDKLQNTVTRGIVSAMRTYENLAFIQSDVAINHGNSGGPLLDERGRVIGLSVSGLERNGALAGLNFFIPIDDALRALALQPVLISTAGATRPTAGR